MSPRPKAPAKSPLSGPYLVRNPVWNAWLRAQDSVLGMLHGHGDGSATHTGTPKRVLVAVGGHLGDGVIATGFLPRLARAFPGAEIGIVCGSWNRRTFESHPRVRWIHVVDHWKLNRSRASFVTHWLETRRTRARAIVEIRAVGYDVAIDLSPYYPNAARLLWTAGVPVRVGYTSGGGGPLLTHPVAWSPRGHVADEHGWLLEQIAPSGGGAPDVAAGYELPEIPAEMVARTERRLSALGLRPESKGEGAYVVMHIGAGHPRKEWPLERWKTVARELAALGARIVVTGAGERQTQLARELVDAVQGAVSLSDQLDWNELRAVLARARLVLSVDTVAMHLAGAAGTPCVALMTGMDLPARWRPLGAQVTVLTEAVPCAPCFRSRGCAEMSCIRELSTASVLEAARAYL